MSFWGFRQLIMRSALPFAYVFLMAYATEGRTIEAHHVIECSIYDHQGELKRRVPGGICVFLADGSYVFSDSSNHAFARVAPSGSVIWRKKLPIHHQINWDPEERTLLILTSSVHPYAGRQTRFDRLEIRNLNGEVLRAFDFFAFRKELARLADRQADFGNTIDRPPAGLPGFEFSHANSFYRIPENNSDLPAFKAGNYIVNANGIGLVFILDPALKKILWSLRHVGQKKGDWGYHDVQVTPAGKLLVYNNSASPPPARHSEIQEIDPRTSAVRTLFKGAPPASFASVNFGGVQLLNGGGLLFSDMTNGGRAIETDAAGKIVWEFRPPVVNAETGKPFAFQQIKRLDLSEFLKRNVEL